ncbi:MAG TPA: DUF3221 domain-containing protein [Methanobacteriaceae archaeon]|nr:DUF3221 domain-containing protein [Methanobacteriaceae archaeon]
MRVITLIAMLFVLFLGVAYGVYCATGEEPADMKGKVVGVCQAGPEDGINNTNSVLVEGIMVGSNQTVNVSVKISPETVIMEKEGNKRNNASFDSIKPGESVEMRFTGPFLQSYPPQTTASQILIVK